MPKCIALFQITAKHLFEYSKPSNYQTEILNFIAFRVFRQR